jgi:V/A-type H+/Na+-transporting ATPase subunit D
MATNQPIATRQELIKLKTKTKSAQRGRTLLKDKRDSLMKHFFEIMKQAIELREKFENEYAHIWAEFQQASARVDTQYMRTLTDTVTVDLQIESTLKNIMSVKLPQLKSQVIGEPTQYSLSETNAQLDSSLSSLRELIPDILRLIEYEYAALLLAREIEKTRRRVNSLDYVVIPELQAHTKGIRSKLEEQARDATIALMKVKAKIA